MSRKRGYEVLILITYLAMVVVCVYLNFFTKTQAGNLTNMIVNIAMFVIAGLILLFSVTGSLIPVSGITADLIKVTKKIENDAMHTHRFLWEKYSEDKGVGIRRGYEPPNLLPMEAQRDAWEILSAEKTLRITMTDGFMLRPIKSNGTIYTISDNPNEFNVKHDCGNCDMKNCPNRHTTR